jgi:iron-sulfur cluster repair protein YtfE (RIC family)
MRQEMVNLAKKVSKIEIDKDDIIQELKSELESLQKLHGLNANQKDLKIKDLEEKL